MTNSTTLDLTGADTITITGADDPYKDIMWHSMSVGSGAGMAVSPPGVAGGSPGYVYTTNTTGGYSWASAPNPVTIHQSGTIDLKGENADININGESLMATLKEIRDHLRIPDRLVQNAELERDYEELRALGEQYREMEAKYKSHKQVFDILKRED